MSDEFLTVEEVATLLKVHQQTVRNWVDRHELSAVRVGSRRVRIRQSDLDAFIEANSSNPTADEPLEMLLDEGSITAWATFAAAMAEAAATLEQTERSELVRSLDSLAAAIRTLVDSLNTPAAAAAKDQAPP